MASGHRGRGNQSGSERERPRRLGGLAARESVQFNNLPLSMSGKPSGAPWIALALLLEGAHDVDLPPPRFSLGQLFGRRPADPVEERVNALRQVIESRP